MAVRRIKSGPVVAEAQDRPGLETIREALGIDRPASGTEQVALDRILGLLGQGLALRAIAKRLDQEGYPTERAGNWYGSTVRVLLLKYAASSPEVRRAFARGRAARREERERRRAEEEAAVRGLIAESIRKSQAGTGARGEVA